MGGYMQDYILKGNNEEVQTDLVIKDYEYRI